MTIHPASLVLLGCLMGLPMAAAADQYCRSESEIPSTAPNSRYTNHGDGTVTDHETGLMWAQCAQGSSGVDCNSGVVQSLNWSDAMLSAEVSVLAGYTDWRLPNIKELSSLVERRCGNPALNVAMFPNTPLTEYWSSSPSTFNNSDAWVWYVISGDALGTTDRFSAVPVRLVRSGS